MATETPLGDGLYLDTRCDSYVWRGRVGGKPVRKAIRHEQTGIVATTRTMTRSEARTIAKQMRADAAKQTGVFAKADANGLTVREAWKLYWDRDGSKHKSSTQKKSIWEMTIEPAWGDRSLASITKRDCSELIERVLAAALARGEAGTTANNVHKTIKRFFSWCVDEGDGATGLEASPMAGKRKKPVKTKPRKRALDERELGWLFRALARVGGRESQALEFLLRSMCRRTETLGAPWGWLRDDGILIPGSATKNGFPLMLPLAPTMRAVIGERPDGAKDDEPIFGASVHWLAHTIEKVRPIMTEIAVEEGFNGDFDVEPFHFSLHDWRDTAKTWMQQQLREDHEPQFSRETQESCLNHREQGVGAIYNAALGDPHWFYAQRKRAGEAWNTFLDAVKAKALAPDAIAA